MEILSRQRPQIVSGDFSTNFHPFWPCNGSLESSNPTLFNHMGTSHFNTSYSIRSCSFLSKFFLLILTGSIASKGILFLHCTTMANCGLCEKTEVGSDLIKFWRWSVIINNLMTLIGQNMSAKWDKNKTNIIYTHFTFVNVPANQFYHNKCT